ncbi:phosphoesterase [Polaribacter sejongensis]|uniref:Phosphoesterase n=1 Tax=Polaribacter sejongensis TaxID=985043 RepID=A0AAJ1QVZ1_9FLAO|nr:MULTISPECIES: metallophosphoesterase [Polaribacter]AUC22753.1 phosphoesterase [Polaribacter sejongensis]MDN3618980.1 metallophosphoesterase [Polaribacter undariae]UWD33068.1 metallophosphoesterase [Polaribacter undariae]
MERRKFIKNTLLTGVGASIVGGLYSWQIEPFWLEFVNIKMPIKNLPKNLIGKTLMQISDIHVGNKFDYKYIIESFKKAQLYNPDFVVYTGDFVSYETPEQFDQLEEVFKYAVNGKLGTAGVLGNHDYGINWLEPKVADTISNILDRENITILRNDEVSFNGLNFLGIDDYWGSNFNPVNIMNKYDAKKANVVLCHNPDVCDLNVWNNYKGWILSGHTHGGQVKPPFLPPPILPVKNKRYSSGEFDLYDGRTLYINRALGNLHQVRLNVRPEITIFELEEEV